MSRSSLERDEANMYSAPHPPPPQPLAYSHSTLPMVAGSYAPQAVLSNAQYTQTAGYAMPQYAPHNYTAGYVATASGQYNAATYPSLGMSQQQQYPFAIQTAGHIPINGSIPAPPTHSAATVPVPVVAGQAPLPVPVPVPAPGSLPEQLPPLHGNDDADDPKVGK